MGTFVWKVSFPAFQTLTFIGYACMYGQAQLKPVACFEMGWEVFYRLGRVFPSILHFFRKKNKIRFN